MNSNTIINQLEMFQVLIDELDRSIEELKQNIEMDEEELNNG